MTKPEERVRASEDWSPHGGAGQDTAIILAALREEMERLYALRDISLPSPGLAHHGEPLVVTLPADPDAPLDHFSASPETSRDGLRGEQPEDMAAEQAHAAVAAGIHMPYWGLLWASGQALAETILAEQEQFRGKRVLELGCGLGLATAAGLVAGAWQCAVDCFAEALLFTRYNGLRAAGRMPETRLLDWRTPVGQEACQALRPFDIVVAADVLYEEEDLDPLLELIPTLLNPSGVFWLAEPGRRVSGKFVNAAKGRGWQDRECKFQRSWPPDEEVVQVVVHRLKTPG